MVSSILLPFSYPKRFIPIYYEKKIKNKFLLYSLEKAFKNTIFMVTQVILSNSVILRLVSIHSRV